MKIKKFNKLSLNKQTVASLNSLSSVKGGIGNFTFMKPSGFVCEDTTGRATLIENSCKLSFCQPCKAITFNQTFIMSTIPTNNSGTITITLNCR